MSDNNKVNVWFPDESYCSVDSQTKEGHPVVIIIQDSLKKFEFKDVFAWNLSIVFYLNDAGDNGMPSGDEIGVVQDYCETLEKLFNDNPEKPNALFLFRETYDGISHVVWRVYDADEVDAVLQKVIEEKNHPREFDYEMEYDEEWKLVEWYLQNFPCKQ
jgi:hypothetical protein